MNKSKWKWAFSHSSSRILSFNASRSPFLTATITYAKFPGLASDALIEQQRPRPFRYQHGSGSFSFSISPSRVSTVRSSSGGSNAMALDTVVLVVFKDSVTKRNY